MIPVIALVIILHTGIETVAYYPAGIWGHLQCEMDKDRAEKYYLTHFSCVATGGV